MLILFLLSQQSYDGIGSNYLSRSTRLVYASHKHGLHSEQVCIEILKEIFLPPNNGLFLLCNSTQAYDVKTSIADRCFPIYCSSFEFCIESSFAS